jgi:quinol monooxygenase YgiN
LEYNPANMPKSKGRKSAARRPRRSSRGLKTTKLPKDAVTLIVILRSKEGQEPLLEAELRALVGPTRKEDGCLQYDLHRGLEHPSTYLLHEVWASREHHTAHTRTPHFLRWNARKDSLLVSRDSTIWHHIA